MLVQSVQHAPRVIYAFPLVLACLDSKIDFDSNSHVPKPFDSSSSMFKQCVSAGCKTYCIGAIIQVNWFSARIICMREGMDLLSIETKEENEFIKTLLIPGDRFWTSGTDLGQPDRHFVWFATGERLTFTDWLAGEPNHQGPENCLELRPLDGVVYWNDFNCLRGNYFICEYSHY